MTVKNTQPLAGHAAAEKKKTAKDMPLRMVAENREKEHRSGSKGITHALMTHLERYAGHEVALAEVNARFCKGFAKYLLRNVEVESARTYLEKLYAVLGTCLRKRYLALNPMPHPTELLPRRDWKERPYLTVEEIQTLAGTDCPSAQTKQAFLFACYTGLRISDIETLTWDMIRHDGSCTLIVKPQQKTGRVVVIPLIHQASLILAQVGRPRRGKVFAMRSRSTVRADLNEWARRAGLAKTITFHSSRHSFATMLVSGNVDIYTISKLCGHSDVKVTERYAHITEKRLKDGVLAIEGQLVGQETEHPTWPVR